jgi:hypothetical protein
MAQVVEAEIFDPCPPAGVREGCSDVVKVFIYNTDLRLAYEDELTSKTTRLFG